MPFSISSYRPNSQIMPAFRQAYGQGGPLQGVQADVEGRVHVVLNNVRMAAQGRPAGMTQVPPPFATVQDRVLALLRGRR